MRRAWPAALLVSVAAVGLALAAGGTSAVRTLLVCWFLAVCPGMAVVRGAGVGRGWDAMALAVGLSVALALLASGALLYLGVLSGAGVFAILAAITVAGVAAELVRPPEEADAT